MAILTIDGRRIEVDQGATILDAARTLGIRIPTLCHVDGCEPSASCFLCAVQIEGKAAFAPSCATLAADGAVVHTDSEAVRRSRRLALELLLSDHAGDCVGPCQTGCPAGFDIPGFIAELAAGSIERSAEIAADFLTLPAALGRICPRLCEQRCHHCESGDALSVGSLHRFAADADLSSAARYTPKKTPATGKRVAIVGAGPAGIAAAYHLLRRGHGVTLFDAHDEPGGMLRYGIPAFRLPPDVLGREIEMIRILGGDFRMGTTLGVQMTLADLRRDFDAVFLAIGAQHSRPLDCEGDGHALPAVALLDRVAVGCPPSLGQTVVVVGGGNTAMDAARTAVRIGASDVTVFYRRTRREMPCLMAEVEAAEAEGVRVETLVAPIRLERVADHDLRLTCIRMQLGAPDASGRPRPVPVPGSEFTLTVSSVVSAIGQVVDTSAVRDGALGLSASGISINPRTLETTLAGVFAGGDAVTGADLAIRAVAAGSLAAVSIDQSLGGRTVVGDPQRVSVVMRGMSEGELAAFFRDVEQTPRSVMPERPPGDRRMNFDEVELGFSAEVARREARRCAQCGCSKAGSCNLRQLATEYGADAQRFAGSRRPFGRDESHPDIVYEPGKCILCGACVAAAIAAGDGLGLSIVGRGFDATVAVPLRGSMIEGLPTAARRAAEVCPTGAFSIKSDGGRGCGRGGRDGREQTYELRFVRPEPRT
ncbi:MAG: FAD-dependent oxidoreductase [Acidobacteriota bacterium]